MKDTGFARRMNCECIVVFVRIGLCLCLLGCGVLLVCVGSWCEYRAPWVCCVHWEWRVICALWLIWVGCVCVCVCV